LSAMVSPAFLFDKTIIFHSINHFKWKQRPDAVREGIDGNFLEKSGKVRYTLKMCSMKHAY
jgi:hypothetical protein